MPFLEGTVLESGTGPLDCRATGPVPDPQNTDSRCPVSSVILPTKTRVGKLICI